MILDASKQCTNCFQIHIILWQQQQKIEWFPHNKIDNDDDLNNCDAFFSVVFLCSFQFTCASRSVWWSVNLHLFAWVCCSSLRLHLIRTVPNCFAIIRLLKRQKFYCGVSSLFIGLFMTFGGNEQRTIHSNWKLLSIWYKSWMIL